MLALKPASATNLILLPKRGYQECPLCGELHPIMMRGIVTDIENDSPNVSHDKGYSFCNCYNIFYTDWRNIRKEKYDETYFAKYQSKNTIIHAKKEFDRIFSIVKEYIQEPAEFFEIGCIHDCLLDIAKEHGFEVYGIDIVKRPTKYSILFCDMEEY